ncbi:MAG: hypothetical protein HeimC3_53400 [Candidatus Heimdallarchaeota archaeon LC_3]|nr:MAG: hypothetical protein HeimC3_53400 [Candidatus Heimdallarchaeota archaeon LC_3]
MKIWKISAGYGSQDWEEWKEESYCKLGQWRKKYYLKIKRDLKKGYENEQDFFTKTKFKGSPINDWRKQLADFTWGIKKNDIIFCYKHKYFVGWTVITKDSKYYYQSSGHFRNVEWHDFDPPINLFPYKWMLYGVLPDINLSNRNVGKFQSFFGCRLTNYGSVKKELDF